MRRYILIFSLLVLSACDHFDDDQQVITDQIKADSKVVEDNATHNVMRVTDNARDAVKRTGERVRKWWLTPMPSTEKLPMPPSYCYRVMQDILCYRQPMPGWEAKLVGYQGTGATPPGAAVTRPLPRSDNDTSNLPAARAAKAKPVFVGIPPEVKAVKKDVETITIDTSHEPLPDPALAPQL